MNGRDAVVTAINEQNWRAALHTLRDEHGRGLSRWLAGQYGVSQRTAQRWMARAGLSLGRQGITPRGTVQISLMRHALAYRLTQTGRLYTGTVQVRYDGRNEGARNIGSVPVDRTDLNMAASAIILGDYGRAAEHIEHAILEGYGEGLSEILQIDDWQEGWTVE